MFPETQMCLQNHEKAELNEIKENGGKLFEADMEVLKLEDTQAISFPDVVMACTVESA